MRKYEIMVIIDPAIDERQVPAILEKYEKVVTDESGTVDSTDIWGKRRLAYEIDKKSEAIYAVIDITANPSTTDELDRLLRIDERFLRHKVMRTDNK